MKQDCSLRDIQNRILDVMIYIDDICRKNNINYFLSGGTLLGAIRHKGFIPWDDDADIMMPRKDYEKFVKTVENENNERYKIGSPKIDSKWTRPWTRVWDSYTKITHDYIQEDEIGVFVDVFPLDGLPANEIFTKLHYYRMKLLYVMRSAAVRKDFIEGEKFRFIKNRISSHAKKNGANYYSRKIDSTASKRSFNKSKNVGAALLIIHMENELFPRKAFDKTIEVDFEGRKFFAPAGYDIYLKKLYGDYMKLPEKAKQITDHLFKIEMIKEDSK